MEPSDFPASGSHRQLRSSGRVAGGDPASMATSSYRNRNIKQYHLGKTLGNGSFGVVSEAKCESTGETVAIKKVLQDPRYKNRELDIMKELQHPNVVKLRDWFYTEETRAPTTSSELFLNVVMDFVPETAHRVMKGYVKAKKTMPSFLVKLYIYQMCRALGYLHAIGICHRDIKPQNLLVDSQSNVLKLCDFGSAKRFVEGEASVAYICSRYYRAPELMLGARQYTTAIDTWSIGCVLGEFFLGHPLFAGDTSVDQLVKIIQILGTPNQQQMEAMNPHYADFEFPNVSRKPWNKLFNDPPSAEGLDLLDKFLKYDPKQRLKPLDALAHPYFDELRQPNARPPLGGYLPPLFNFTPEEISEVSPHVRQTICQQQ